MEKRSNNLFSRVIYFYIDGFKSMTVGRTLWLVIFIKLFIMFAILKLFFFPNFLKSNFDNDDDRAQYVRTTLIED
ncbi:MAG: DUF4492 domain-containing protein [Bacteroidales bacterium]